LATDRGRLTVDVVAAPEDGRLIVDAAFAGYTADRSPIRIAISTLGDLDPLASACKKKPGLWPGFEVTGMRAQILIRASNPIWKGAPVFG
jgi:hypothetical protein